MVRKLDSFKTTPGVVVLTALNSYDGSAVAGLYLVRTRLNILLLGEIPGAS